jgi:AAA15 family ATPase/GTPase
MIIELKLKNWMSFRDETVFSLAATSEKRLRDRLPKIRKNPVLNVSPIAALYGGNASGKTNFFKLIAFLKQLPVNLIITRILSLFLLILMKPQL